MLRKTNEREKMNLCRFTEKIYNFEVDNRKYHFTVRIPEIQSKRPVLLISLAGDCKTALNYPAYNVVPCIFLAAGHNVASFDLPNHGEHIDEFGEGLNGWANAISNGIDIFNVIRKIGSNVINITLKENLAWDETIVLSGVSRGALSTMHIMAEDRRVFATACIAPCVDLSVLREFQELKNHSVIIGSKLENIISKIKNRFIFITIGETDPRVDAKLCFEFYAKLHAASDSIKPELFVLPGQTHGNTAFLEAGYLSAASFLFEKISMKIKGAIKT